MAPEAPRAKEELVRVHVSAIVFGGTSGTYCNYEHQPLWDSDQEPPSDIWIITAAPVFLFGFADGIPTSKTLADPS